MWKSNSITTLFQVSTTEKADILFDFSVKKMKKIKMIENLSLSEDIIFNLEYLDSVCSTNICVINAANYYYHTNGSSL